MAASKRAKRTKQADSFQLAQLLSFLRPRVFTAGAYSWDLESIRAARDAQMMGRFSQAAKMAASMRTDDAIFTARKNRLAPLRSLAIALAAAPGPKGASICGEGDALFGQDGIAISRDTIADLNGDLADHGFAVGYNDWTTRKDGSRVDVVHHAWPMEHISWHAQERTLKTFGEGDAAAGLLIPITHGDGRWVVYRNHETLPWQQDAAMLPGALVWARHAFASRDWARGSASHGNAKVIGTLAEGVELQSKNEDGASVMTDDAAAFLALLQDVASLDTPVGIAPYGSTVQYLTNSSGAWEVWREMMISAEKAAAKIYLGTDGTLGAAGGAPGVDITALFGIATTIMQGDISAIERGLQTGVIEPWTAINFGDTSLAPRRRYVVTDPDTQRVRAELATNEAAMVAAVQARRAAGFVVTQEYCDKLSEQYGVEALELAATLATSIGIQPNVTAPAVVPAPAV